MPTAHAQTTPPGPAAPPQPAASLMVDLDALAAERRVTWSRGDCSFNRAVLARRGNGWHVTVGEINDDVYERMTLAFAIAMVAIAGEGLGSREIVDDRYQCKGLTPRERDETIGWAGAALMPTDRVIAATERGILTQQTAEEIFGIPQQAALSRMREVLKDLPRPYPLRGTASRIKLS